MKLAPLLLLFLAGCVDQTVTTETVRGVVTRISLHDRCTMFVVRSDDGSTRSFWIGGDYMSFINSGDRVTATLRNGPPGNWIALEAK